MAGRPKAVVDWKRVDQMLMAQCTAVEIADSQGVTADTLYNACKRDHKQDFSAYSQQKRAKGVATAREKFYEEAFIGKPVDKGRPARQIFWLKNHAGMADKQEVKHSGEMGPQLVMYLPDNGKAAPVASDDNG